MGPPFKYQCDTAGSIQIRHPDLPVRAALARCLPPLARRHPILLQHPLRGLRAFLQPTCQRLGGEALPHTVEVIRPSLINAGTACRHVPCITGFLPQGWDGHNHYLHAQPCGTLCLRVYTEDSVMASLHCLPLRLLPLTPSAHKQHPVPHAVSRCCCLLATCPQTHPAPSSPRCALRTPAKPTCSTSHS